MSYPASYRYSKSHEWINIEGITATVGITDYAQSSLGDIVFVDLPKPGSKFAAGETFGSVESVKAVSDLYAPVSGTVAEANGSLESAPESLNADANNIWLLKLTDVDASAATDLMDADAYTKFVAEETGH